MEIKWQTQFIEFDKEEILLSQKELRRTLTPANWCIKAELELPFDESIWNGGSSTWTIAGIWTSINTWTSTRTSWTSTVAKEAAWIE